MCRWFAYISATEPCLLEDVLITPKHSLVKQVHQHYLPGLIGRDPDHDSKDEALIRAANSIVNIDGLGVAWYTSSAADFESSPDPDGSDDDDNHNNDGNRIQKQGLRPAAYKTIVPPINDINFRSICANTETKVCFGHIRASSGTPIVHVNNHPFIFGRHTCMHNGGVSGFDLIRRAMCARMSNAAYAAMLGSTDSEHVFALYMTYLTKSGDASTFENSYPIEAMAAALHDAVATTISLQLSIIGAQSLKPSSLNLCVTDGQKLIAYRFRNHARLQPPSLYYSTSAGTTLNRKYPGNPDDNDDGETSNEVSPGTRSATARQQRKAREHHGKHLIVASEPSTSNPRDWTIIQKNTLLMADGDGRVKILDIPYDKAWDAQDS